jgi:RTX calcium-binding nonapeptide repeat (4 copies)/Bacterial Ig domain/PA domain
VMFPQIRSGEQAFDETILHHDVIVKHIDGVPVMKSDYWDAGYVQLDVSDPSNPRLRTDTTFAGEDPLFPGSGLTPEGNAHQGEFSFDNQFLLGADEDFNQYRLIQEIGGQPADPPFGFAVPVDANGNPIPELQIAPGDPFAGGTRFIGDGCNPATIPAPTPTTTIAVAERGGVLPDGVTPCGFENKAANAEAVGYEGLVIFNNVGPPPPPANRCETLINMVFTDPPIASIKTIFVGRRDGLRILGALPTPYSCVQGNPATSTPSPAVGTEGETINLEAVFDGWGYAHLYDAKTSAHLDAFAIPEALDERYAVGFGDLSIHEFAADPTENLAYSSYYSGGIRVLRFSRANGLEQVGAWIDAEGSNFWGIEQFTTPQGERLIAGSDRDFGLVILRYTGPGAARPPVCSDVTVMVAFRESTDVPLPCTDPNGNPLRQSRLSNPGGGTLTDRPAGGWTYRHTGREIGPAGSFTFRANDGAANSNVATANLVAVAKRGRCVNPFIGTNRRDVIIGSRFGDRVRGRRGNDSLRGRAGRDCLFGNAGRDRMSGHGHADRLSGNGGRDRIAGNAGRDRLFGNQGNDRLLGGGGPDRLRGGGGSNSYSAGGGHDRVDARNGQRDRVRCGRGRDRVQADQNDRVAGDCETVRR